jgi:hypothetical protein
VAPSVLKLVLTGLGQLDGQSLLAKHGTPSAGGIAVQIVAALGASPFLQDVLATRRTCPAHDERGNATALALNQSTRLDSLLRCSVVVRQE